jgi:hypothetical protein
MGFFDILLGNWGFELGSVLDQFSRTFSFLIYENYFFLYLFLLVVLFIYGLKLLYMILFSLF